jgi:hypothetical protein
MPTDNMVQLLVWKRTGKKTPTTFYHQPKGTYAAGSTSLPSHSFKMMHYGGAVSRAVNRPLFGVPLSLAPTISFKRAGRFGAGKQPLP